MADYKKKEKRATNASAYKMRWLEWEQGLTFVEKKPYPRFTNYFVGEYGKVMPMLITHLVDSGISRNKIAEVYADEVGMPIPLAKRKIAGKSDMAVWEMYNFCKLFKFNMSITPTDLKHLSYRIEDEDALIIEMEGIYNFVLRINLKNYLDIAITYKRNKQYDLHPNYRKLRAIMKEMIEYYFFDQCGKRKYPFNEKKFMVAVRTLYYSNNIKGLLPYNVNLI